MNRRAPLNILACDAANALAESIARHLRCPVVKSHDIWFSCGEGKHVIDANIRGTDCYIVQRALVPGSERSIYDGLVMLLHAIDAARLADADRITVILPYLPGSRQDKRKQGVREGVSTGLFARMLSAAGADMVLTVEPHNEAVVGCYSPRDTVFEGLSVFRAFARFLKREGMGAEVVASTDVGGLETARVVANELGCSLAALSKERDYSQSSVVTKATLIGDVQGRSVLIVDDIVDTAGSVCAAVRELWDNGATDVSVAAVHTILSGPGFDRLNALAADAAKRNKTFRLVGTTSILHNDAPDWYHLFPIEPLLARAINSINQRGSVRAVES